MSFHTHVRTILNAADNFFTVAKNNVKSIKNIYDSKDDESISILRDVLDIDVDNINKLIGLNKVNHDNDVIQYLKSSLYYTISDISCNFSMTAIVPKVTNMLGKVATLCEASIPKENKEQSKLDDTCGEAYFHGMELIKEISENHELLDDFSKDFGKNYEGNCQVNHSLEAPQSFDVAASSAVRHDL